jgi:hypothetical protein
LVQQNSVAVHVISVALRALRHPVHRTSALIHNNSEPREEMTHANTKKRGQVSSRRGLVFLVDPLEHPKNVLTRRHDRLVG